MRADSAAIKKERARALATQARALEELVHERLEAYVAALQGHLPRDLYALIMPQLERPLIRVAMSLAEGRQSVAATMLGIHRNTLRARIRELGLEDEFTAKPRR
ncbi:MAG: Fis family transcriptional regulator [Deltaproteobacteria bacterium]|nr:Fis family transcriptional regulator [Deltaproteobacteria bacterium]